MKLLILGAKGQLGRAIQHQCQWHKLPFLALCHQQLDITDTAALQKVLLAYVPTVVINCAAYTHVDRAESNIQLAHQINAIAPAQLGELCKAISALLIHLSTDYVFNGQATQPYTELDTPAPLNIYGKTKLAGEIGVQQSGCQYAIIRTSWLFDLQSHNFYTRMCQLALQSEPVAVVADQYGGPTYAPALAYELVKVLRQYQSISVFPVGLYHVSGYPYVSRYQFAQAIFAALQSNTPLLAITTGQFGSEALRPASSALNMVKFCQTFSTNQPDWQEAIASAP